MAFNRKGHPVELDTFLESEPPETVEEIKAMFDNLPTPEVEMLMAGPGEFMRTPGEGLLMLTTPSGTYVYRESNTWKSQDLGAGVIQFSQFRDQSLVEQSTDRRTVPPSC